MKTTFKTFPHSSEITNASPRAIRKTLPAAAEELSPNQGIWARRSGGGALLLMLAALLPPAVATAAVCTGCNGEEVIEIEGTAPGAPKPWNPDGYSGIGSGGSTGNPAAPNGTPSGDSAGGGISGGSEPASSGGTNAAKATQKRIENARDLCDMTPGTWDENVIFHDKGIETNKKLIGFRCSSRFADPSGGLRYSVTYYDSRGFYNYGCDSTAEKTVCAAAAP